MPVSSNSSMSTCKRRMESHFGFQWTILLVCSSENGWITFCSSLSSGSLILTVVRSYYRKALAVGYKRCSRPGDRPRWRMVMMRCES